MISIAGYEWGWDNARALIGIVLIYGVCWLLSEKRKLFPLKLVIGATLMQFAFALILFGVPFVRAILFKANDVVDGLQAATRAGTSFVFGYVGDNVAAEQLMGGSPPPLFFFQILPIVIVVAALSAILWHWRILRWVTNGFAFIFRRGMGLGGATSLAVSANVFMGMTEAPVLIRPYIKGMTRSELLIMMTAGFATIAGSVLVVYGAFLEGKMANPLAQLLTASIIAAPAAVAVALAMIPETTPATERMKEPDFNYASTMDAFSRGASDGLQIVLNIATMLIAALALLWLVNAGLGALPHVAGAPLSIERILGWIFAPLMYMIGVPLDEAAKSGSLMGVKTVLTEFVAFLQLAEVPVDAMDPRTRMITAHAICGFANFGSMGILIGGLTIVEPARRDDFLSLSWRTLLAGTLATCLSGAVVGALPYQLFTGGAG
ncbi:Na+ dependent nucleoside transporter domain-containing protein [Hyphomonas beringensis]|uniref:Na+ dependent nucleoside transporter domain-containing protein n=1 Tax=Hyphomonas beringensis TaxID=1280946 RepID=A0A062UG59_9PROT|nr:nucleoside transporter C-terminal domain-containing protein [Hyphomonas beringensis]KCZ55100.1 Na+ dependent nucleoside transporter domain-containing protein [Hyphomonas beringensis]